jgi:hypothetical protein
MKAARKRKLLAIARRLPEVELREEAGHFGLVVRKKTFAWYLDNHHDDGMVALSFKAPPGINHVLVATDAAAYFIPAYSGAKGWGAVRLDQDDVDWAQVERHLVEAYKLSAPKTLLKSLG